MGNIRAGELRHRITFQTNTPTQNAQGEFVDTWTDFATVWGAIEPLRGNRLFSAQQANSLVTGIIRIRPLEGIEPTMRATCESSYYQIISIINLDELQIMYKEIID